MVIPITDKQHEYADSLTKKLEAAGFRAECDVRSEKMGFKIREAQLQKIPYMLVVGDKEIETGSVSVRSRSGGDLGTMPVADFMAKLKEEIDTKFFELK
ncbi:Threonine--tRNA ligase [bioreactor metagenome]|uniref:Threonine--tRNA ligase n=1 Tax=bioreactor metagenome TaxID=1076179 RepID=A0A645C1Z0_9ZZZZ